MSQPTQQETIPESIIEIVVEPSVSVPNSEQIQNQTLSVSDQSSSSSDIQILEQPPLDILKSEYFESELLKINKEMQALVQLRRVPTLSIDYEDRWTSLKSKASELLDAVSQKCLRIQVAAVRRHLEPFYSESEYVSREAKVFKMLKQKMVKQQEESKAREDSLLQRQLALEETVKQ